MYTARLLNSYTLDIVSNRNVNGSTSFSETVAIHLPFPFLTQRSFNVPF